MTQTTTPTATTAAAHTVSMPAPRDGDAEILRRIAASRARREALAPGGLFPEDSPVVCPEVNAHPFAI